MRVDLDDSLFAPPARPLDVLGLLAVCDRMGHVLASHPEAVDAWADTLSPGTAGAVVQLLDTHRERVPQLSAATQRVTVQASQPSRWAAARLDVDDAWRFLRAPLELLVENERSDWSFVRRLATPAQRAVLDEAIARGSLQVRQGGGITEIGKAVQALFEEVGDPDLDAHRRVRRLRTWVLFDRDAHEDDDTLPGKKADDAQRQCERSTPDDPWALPFHRLRRRHIECYLPDAVLRDWARGRGPAEKARVEALLALRVSDPEAAHSLHMKKGLLASLTKAQRKEFGSDGQSPDPNTRRAAEQRIDTWRPPWGRLTPEQRADLLVGFGSDAARLFTSAPSPQDPLFAAEFDRYEHRTASELVESIVERV